MLEYLRSNLIFTLIIALIIGVVIGFVLVNSKKIFIVFFKRFGLIKNYWIVIIPLLVITIISYAIVFHASKIDNISTNISILGHFVTLIFAIFIGYYAFLQVLEGRVEKFKEQAFKCLKNRRYMRAQKYYEKALAIHNDDFENLTDLLELYIIIRDFSMFDDKIILGEKLALDIKDKLVIYYLKISKTLIQMNQGSARSLLSSFMLFIKSNPAALDYFSWDYSDLETSETYKKLDGECKQILDTFKKYLKKQATPDEINSFEEAYS